MNSATGLAVAHAQAFDQLGYSDTSGAQLIEDGLLGLADAATYPITLLCEIKK